MRQPHRPASRFPIAPMLILWLACAARLFGLDAVRHEFDWAVPHAAGIAILQALARGDFGALPLVGAGASIAVPNPALSSYFWAVIAVFSRSPLVATAISAMLGVLAVALTLDLARRLMGRPAALWAGMLAATSPWSLYFARGTWLQGQTEFCAALVAWLVIVALQKRQAKRLFAGLLAAAILAHTYLVAFGLLAQSGLAVLLSLRSNLVRAGVAGLGVSIVSIALFAAIISGQASELAEPIQPSAANSTASQMSIKQDGIFHTLRLVSGRDHEAAGEDRLDAMRAPAKVWTDGRASFIEGMLGAGLVMLAAGWVRLRGGLRMNWIMCAWLVLPPLVSIVVTRARPHWLVHPAYMLLTAPAGYLVAAAPIAWLATRLHTAKTLAIVTFISLPVVLIGLNRQVAFVQDSYRQPFVGRLAWLPLHDQMRLQAVWQAHCDDVATDEDVRWTASIFQSAARVLPLNDFAYERRTASGHIWWMPLNRRRCLSVSAVRALETLRPLSYPTVHAHIPLAASFPITLADGTIITTTQLAPITPPLDFVPLNTNLGWQLLRLETPAQAMAGITITVQHAWRIETLPSEAYADWYYAPFVKLIAPDGREVAQVDSAPSVLGHEWRAGDTLISDIALHIPLDMPPGDYALEFSLFDPNQKKNAVYFAPDQPAQARVMLRRPLRIAPAH